VLAPHQLDGRGDAGVHGGEVVHMVHVEALQQAHRGRAPLGRLVERPQEELVELAVEQRPVGERVAEHEPVAAQLPLTGDPSERAADERQVPDRDERTEPEPDVAGRFGVDQAEATQALVARHRVTGDHPAAVVPDDGDAVDAEEVDHALHVRDLACDGDLGGRVEPTRAGAGEVDHMTGHVVDEVREQAAEGGTADGPAVDEQHVAAGADRAEGDLAAPHLEEAIGWPTEQIGGGGGGERGHGHLLGCQRRVSDGDG
jgi:hypothetical protein